MVLCVNSFTISKGLDQNPENLFLGMVWCQGEWDSENALAVAQVMSKRLQSERNK